MKVMIYNHKQIVINNKNKINLNQVIMIKMIIINNKMKMKMKV